MSVLGTAMQAGLRALGGASGQTLEYRVGTGGAWTTLSNGFLEQTMPQEIVQNEHGLGVMIPARAVLRVADGGPRLLPGSALKPGDFIRHTINATKTEWGIVGASYIDGVAVYDCERRIPSTVGNVPGSVH